MNMRTVTKAKIGDIVVDKLTNQNGFPTEQSYIIIGKTRNHYTIVKYNYGDDYKEILQKAKTKTLDREIGQIGIAVLKTMTIFRVS